MVSDKNLVVQLMAGAIKDNVFPGGVILVSMGSTIILHQAFGRTDIHTGQSMEPDSIFDLASLTKPLATAMAVIQLIRDGRLSFDQPIGTILGPLSDSGKGIITIDQLLRHTSGLPAHREFFRTMGCPGTPAGRQELRSLLCQEPLVNAVGTREVYSDLGYMLLSWIVEAVTNQRLDRFLENQVYQPLGIKDLFFIETGHYQWLSEERRGRLVPTESCPWRKRILKGEVHDDNAWAAGGVEGHAGLFGSALAVWQLLEEIRSAISGPGSRVIPGDVIKRCILRKGTGDKVAGFDTPSRTGSSSGRYFSNNSIGHLGFTGTSFWMDFESGLSVILLTNRVHPTRTNERIKRFRPVVHDAVAGWLLGRI